jgi:DUF4097 and DUF4098 domain-containing protein YvlB
VRKSSRKLIAMVAPVFFWYGLAGRTNLYAQASIQRGTPQREGRGWVELATCEAPAHEGARLVVRADFGSITVKPGSKDQMNCQVHLRAYRPSEEEARRYFQAYELSLRTLENGDVVLVGRSTQRGEHQGLSVDYRVSVPLKFNLDLETQGGDLNVGNLDGEFRGKTAGGDISSGDISGPVEVVTAGGDITLGNMGQRVEARTAGGAIHLKDVKGDAVLETSGGEIVTGVINGSVNARTAGGDIVLRGASGPVRAETAGGQIQIGQCQGSVKAQTAGGSIRLHGARGMVVAQTAGGSIVLFRLESAVRAQSAAGPILAEINANRSSFAASQLQTAVGDVKVFLPPDLPLTINAAIQQAFGHKILSDFPIRVQGDEQSFRQRSLRAEGELNGGGQLLRIDTVTGNIEIRKLDPKTLQQLKEAQKAFWKAWQERRQQPRENENNPEE